MLQPAAHLPETNTSGTLVRLVLGMITVDTAENDAILFGGMELDVDETGLGGADAVLEGVFHQ